MPMSTPPPRHLTRSRWPWRLGLVAFGLTTAVLAALVASATLLPQPSPPRRAPALALPTVPTEPAPRPAPTPTTAPRAPTTAPTLSTPPQTPGAGPQRAEQRCWTGHGPSAGRGGHDDEQRGVLDRWRHSTQPPVTGPTTTAAPPTTAPTTTAAPTTTTLATTTSTETTTTRPTTTGADPATTASAVP
jgi:hypothetical protein